MGYNKALVLGYVIGAIILLLIIVTIGATIVFVIKHLIKFTARTIYEEKAKAEERHTNNISKASEPEEDR